MKEAADGSDSGGFSGWCHKFIDPVVSGAFERIDAGRLWCGLCPRFPATEALHDADRFAGRAQRLLRELEPERLDEPMKTPYRGGEDRHSTSLSRLRQ